MEHDEASDSVSSAPSSGSADVAVGSLAEGAELMLGLAVAALGAIGEGLLRLRSESADLDATKASDDEPTPAELVEDLGWAALGVGANAAARIASAAAAAVSAIERGGSAVMRHPAAREQVERVADAVRPLGERVQEAQSRGVESGSDLGLDLAATIAREVVDRLDLDAIVDRVDVNRAVDRLDVDRVAARLDVDRLVRRLDLTRITQGVLDQLDLTAIARRVLDELDLTEIARRVIDELELTELIRESTATVSVDTVDAIRVGGMNADRALARLVDRVLMRRSGSTQNGGTPPEDPAAP